MVKEKKNGGKEVIEGEVWNYMVGHSNEPDGGNKSSVKGL